MTLIQDYEIWLVHYPYDDLPKEKIRPVLVLDVDENSSIVQKITSNIFIGGDKYRLIYWKDAGLNKPSVVRIRDRLLSNDKFIHKIGKIHNVDLVNLIGYL